MSPVSAAGHSRRGVVRSHTVIGADPVPAGVHVDLATLLSVDPDAKRRGLRAQAQRVMALCAPGVLSVADVAAHLQLPGGVVRALVAELVASGHLLAADPFVPVAQRHEAEFLERVLHGLERL
ncbi:DUF742 domain-containing protein [Streptomyces prunicolor]|uniref:DUF742 domain-containing protein n=1 Tax=Streptomyces prunicolor TaxID=67348 RepID=UPI00225976DE|nr:DUF742 domain-containing protein [Streptomyces prunicolor]MCX5236958.1 DUF742 domain-containing protein [Streptomyces prunicolor]